MVLREAEDWWKRMLMYGGCMFSSSLDINDIAGFMFVRTPMPPFTGSRHVYLARAARLVGNLIYLTSVTTSSTSAYRSYRPIRSLLPCWLGLDTVLDI